jgi:hypothetical protein
MTFAHPSHAPQSSFPLGAAVATSSLAFVSVPATSTSTSTSYVAAAATSSFVAVPVTAVPAAAPVPVAAAVAAADAPSAADLNPGLLEHQSVALELAAPEVSPASSEAPVDHTREPATPVEAAELEGQRAHSGEAEVRGPTTGELFAVVNRRSRGWVFTAAVAAIASLVLGSLLWKSAPATSPKDGESLAALAVPPLVSAGVEEFSPFTGAPSAPSTAVTAPPGPRAVVEPRVTPSSAASRSADVGRSTKKPVPARKEVPTDLLDAWK